MNERGARQVRKTRQSRFSRASCPQKTMTITQNIEIARKLREVAQLLEDQGANRFRVRAYRTATGPISIRRGSLVGLDSRRRVVRPLGILEGGIPGRDGDRHRPFPLSRLPFTSRQARARSVRTDGGRRLRPTGCHCGDGKCTTFSFPTAATEHDTEKAAWVNPNLRASNGGWFIWSISSIWFVWLIGPEIYPAEPDRPERPSNQTDEPLRVARAQRIGSSALTARLAPAHPYSFA